MTNPEQLTVPSEVKTSIHGLFPEPVGNTSLGRELTEEEHNFLMKLDRKHNTHNEISIDKGVLHHPEMASLLTFVTKEINNFFDFIYQPANNVEVYVTQSWVNYTKEGQAHHSHSHPNSFLSGVFYVNADISEDKIYFERRRYQALFPKPRDFNAFNSEIWFFPVGTGQLIMFRSDLHHHVTPKKGDKDRVSLSFNTFLRGGLGDYDGVTKLDLS